MPVSQLPLPIAPRVALRNVILPAWQLLPPSMSTVAAQVLALAIMLQESALAHRWQVVDLRRPDRMGPARGLSQFELGSRASRGGVWGVFLHPASRYWLAQVCQALHVEFNPRAIWEALAGNDALAACLARLLLFTDPKPLPMGDADAAFDYYLRTWRPGAWQRGNARQRAELRRKFRAHYATALQAARGD